MTHRDETGILRHDDESPIMTLRVVLKRGTFCEGDWMADIKLPDTATLAKLHEAIQDAVEFDDDHIFSFFVARTDRSRDRVYFHHDDEFVITKTLADLFPVQPRKSLFYLFDWGDEWVFKISKSRKALHAPVAGTEYPNVINETGTKPVQYPMYDEDEGLGPETNRS